MTVLGHGSVSYITARMIPKAVVTACIIGGVSPDIDFLFILFPFFNAIHRVVTHNVFFVILMASLLSSMFSSERRKVWLSAFGCGMLHLLVDSMLDQNPTNGLGVALFWPLTGWMFCPINLVAVDPNSEGWSNLSRSLVKMWVIALYEVPFYILAGWLWYKQKSSSVVEWLKNAN